MGDILDGRDPDLGSWHEVSIKKIVKATEEDNSKLKSSTKSEDGSEKLPFPLREDADAFVYHITYDGLVHFMLFLSSLGSYVLPIALD